MPYSKTITQVWTACKTCGKDFLVKRAHYGRVLNCSKACGYAHRKAGSSVTLTCFKCGTSFTTRPSARRDHEYAFCSDACSLGMQRKPQSDWLVGVDGYVYRSGRMGKLLQHRIEMERHLGRPLLDHENVHHINGDKSDNRIENLELWSHHQPKGQRLGDKLEAAKNLLEENGYVVLDPSSGMIGRPFTWCYTPTQ